jgi:hypothetical protein
MKYYYPELVEMLRLNPASVVLRNGVAHIEEVLGLPKTVDKIDPLLEAERLTEALRKERHGR